MALKAGRVGVHPDDVDPVSGHISPDVTSAYTKSECDDKFLSKSDAADDYLKKSDAADDYLSKTDAASAYASKTDVSSLVTSQNFNVAAFTITSGTVGTWFGKQTVDISKTGYTPVGVSLRADSHPSSYLPIVGFSGNTASIDIYRQIATAYNVSEGDIAITAVYVKK